MCILGGAQKRAVESLHELVEGNLHLGCRVPQVCEEDLGSMCVCH